MVERCASMEQARVGKGAEGEEETDEGKEITQGEQAGGESPKKKDEGANKHTHTVAHTHTHAHAPIAHTSHTANTYLDLCMRVSIVQARKRVSQ